MCVSGGGGRRSGLAQLMKVFECQGKELGRIYPLHERVSGEALTRGDMTQLLPWPSSSASVWETLSRPLPSALALSADHQGPETARDCRGHAADRPVHPDLLAGCGPPEKDGGEVQHGGKLWAAAEGACGRSQHVGTVRPPAQLLSCPRRTS